MLGSGQLLREEFRYPSLDQVSRLYAQIIKATGGEHGYLSKSNLDYFLDTVKDVGESLPRRKAIVKKSAFLLYNIIIVHPFLNGNKRTAYELMRLFLTLNGYHVSPDTEEAYEFLLAVASAKNSEADIENWIARHLEKSKEK
jgi:death on curing protein